MYHDVQYFFLTVEVLYINFIALLGRSISGRSNFYFFELLKGKIIT